MGALPPNPRDLALTKFLLKLRQILPHKKGQRLVILADRGFSRASLFKVLAECHFDFVIRLKYDVKVTLGKELKLLGDIAVSKGQKLRWSNVMYRSDGAFQLARLVVTRPEDREGPWFLASFCREPTDVFGK